MKSTLSAKSALLVASIALGASLPLAGVNAADNAGKVTNPMSVTEKDSKVAENDSKAVQTTTEKAANPADHRAETAKERLERDTKEMKAHSPEGAAERAHEKGMNEATGKAGEPKPTKPTDEK